MEDKNKEPWALRALKAGLNYGPAVITVLFGVFVGLFGSFLALSQPQILQIILVLLGLIGTTLLTEKLLLGRAIPRKFDAIDSQMDKLLKVTCDIEAKGLDSLIIRRRDLEPLEERLKGATRIAISGGSLFRLMSEYQRVFEDLAKSGCEMRFLVSDPNSQASLFLSSVVVYESANPETYRENMKNSIKALESIATRHPELCQLRLADFAPPFSVVIIEKGNASCLIQVEIYPFKVPARERPTLLLDKDKDPRLHEFFRDQYNAMWDSNHVSEWKKEPAK